MSRTQFGYDGEMPRFFLLTPLFFCGCSLILSDEPNDNNNNDRDGGIEIDAGEQDGSVRELFHPFGTLKAFTTQDLPSSTITIDTSCMINTDQFEPVNCSPIERVMDGGEFVVIRTSQLKVPADQILRAVGSKSLVIIAKTIDIAGTIDLGSRTAEQLGGAGFRDCNSGDGGNGGDPSGVMGGGGGGFASPGGQGGGPSNGMGQPGGPKADQQDRLLGGCQGGGGSRGGGAIQLVATEILTVSGTIKVGGAGGPGGAANMSGHGGGSGGMMVFDAPSSGLHIEGAALHFTGGGGGGGGGTSTPGAAGEEGGMTGGIGGSPGTNAGQGGNGSASVPEINGSNATAGGGKGGGGGGGSGFCLIHNVTADGGEVTTCASFTRRPRSKVE